MIRVGMVLAFLGAAMLPSRAALEDMLRIEQSKTNDMASRVFDTRQFNTKTLNEFRSIPVQELPASPVFRTGQRPDWLSKKVPLQKAEVFTGRFTVKPLEGPFSGTSSLSGRRAELPDRPGFDTSINALGNRTFVDAGRRYQGPELERKTVEIEVINQILRNKEGVEGRTLRMDEVRAILNARESD